MIKQIWQKRYLVPAGIGFLVLLIVLPSLGKEWLKYDYDGLLQWRLIHDWQNAYRFFIHYIPPEMRSGVYAPLRTAYAALQYSLFGGASLPYQITALVWHLCATVTVYALGRLFAKRPGAAIAALLYGLHPGLTGMVIVPAAALDLPGQALILLCLYCCLRGQRADSVDDGFGWRRWAVRVMAAAVLLSEAALLLPVLFLFMAVFSDRGSSFKERAAGTVPFWVIVLVYCGGKYWAAGSLFPLPAFGFWQGVIRHFGVWTGAPELGVFLNGNILIALIISAGWALTGFMIMRRKNSGFSLGFAAGVCGLLASFLQGGQAAPLIEPYAVFTVLSFSLILSYAFDGLTQRLPKIRWIVFTLIMVSFAVRGVSLGRVLNTPAGYQRYLIRLDPADAEHYYWYGLTKLEMGDLSAARRALQRAVMLRGSGRDYFTLAETFLRLGKGGEAEKFLHHAVLQDPAFTEAYLNFIFLAYHDDRPQDAQKYLNQLLEQWRQNKTYYEAGRGLDDVEMFLQGDL